MFEQLNPNNAPRGAQAVALVLLHQFIATPGTFLVAMVAYGLAPRGEVRVVPGMLFRSLGIALFCFGVALSVGYLVGYFFPARIRFGYGVWILPTLLVPYDFWEHVNFYHHPFKIAVLQYFYPDDVSSEWTFLTSPWIQSFLYSFGLILAAWYTRSKRAPLTTTSK